ncbi:hypothetical protein NUW54_g177 [Trametes sanguinea]|uniref:Uncharacterized protein n=1 Tax=Trametes sanguinea TaxID=158606 RepID=A0ACC1QCX2_9APHY|nr:hypothetical protein NUW54_g177 [Trametes sanguinea]
MLSAAIEPEKPPHDTYSRCTEPAPSRIIACMPPDQILSAPTVIHSCAQQVDILPPMNVVVGLCFYASDPLSIAAPHGASLSPAVTVGVDNAGFAETRMRNLDLAGGSIPATLTRAACLMSRAGRSLLDYKYLCRRCCTRTKATDMSGTAIPQVPSLDSTFGALLIGSFFGCFLYGLTLRQAFAYFKGYADDPKPLKILVSWVLLLETLTLALTVHACYFYLVSSFWNPHELQKSIWSLSVRFPSCLLYCKIVLGVTMASSQSYFARRVWILGHRFRLIVAATLVLCVVELGFLTAGTVKAFVSPEFTLFARYTWLVSIGSTLAVVADFALTVLLVYILHQSRTGLKRTDSMLDVMILYTVNTGLITGVLNLGCLILAFVLPSDLYYAGVGIPGNRTYAICLLAALNARKSLREQGRIASTSLSIPATSLQWDRRTRTRTHTSKVLSSPSTPSDACVELQQMPTSRSSCEVKGDAL